MVEHPFGTIKRQWEYDHTLLKGKEKASADFALIFTADNLRRVMSLLGINAYRIDSPSCLIFLRTFQSRITSLFNTWIAPPANDSGGWAWSPHGVWDSHVPA